MLLSFDRHGTTAYTVGGTLCLIPINVHSLFQVSCIMDPVDDSVYKNIWMATAKVRVVDIWDLAAVFLNQASWHTLFELIKTI